MVAWATPQDVKLITGAVVSTDDIAMAQQIIDLYSGVDSDVVAVSLIWTKDIVRLKKATAYQVKFMVGQVDILSRMDTKSVVQDGVSFTPTNSDANILAPLASRALKQLSWKRSRTLHPSRRGRNMLALAQTWVRDAEPDAELGWTPLSPGSR